VVTILDEDANLAGGVAGHGHECDVSGFRQAQALRERPERLRLQLKERWLEPGWPVLVRNVAA
jgi:hypothetical protein